MTTPIQIRRDDVVRDLRELAALRGQAITDTVAEITRSELARARRQARQADLESAVDAAVAQFRAAVAAQGGGRLIRDEDLYGDDGLPR